jgi:arsenate reductase
MAHGILQSIDNKLVVRSAGTEPAERVNPLAVKVMNEIGIGIGNNKPKNVNEYLYEDWDYVITVCDQANESCPVFIGSVKTRIHIGFEDPSKAIGSEEYILSEFRRIRDKIKDDFFNFHKKYLL